MTLKEELEIIGIPTIVATMFRNVVMPGMSMTSKLPISSFTLIDGFADMG